tara:strand:- start:123 stop:407 length:285 start_codon:yes stop_codon:yes gene_type:complete
MNEEVKVTECDGEFIIPSFPVHPFQDKFNQVHLFMGMTKLETTSIFFLSAILSNPEPWIADPRGFPTIAIDYAIEILDYCKTIQINSASKSKIL